MKTLSEQGVTYENFKAWLQKQDDETLIDYCDNHDCLFARFLKSLGFADVGVSSWAYRVKEGGSYEDIPDEIVNGLDTLVTHKVTFTIKEAKEVFFK